ncbi:MAG: DUF5723 family protein [Candidatus Marinimicrobia bacterium]|nr:DUF5723 family protein [Candidatus Neomarinimicrobiota bacterium]MCF7850092.1 DUF5723 family protein [Candidatus Neomarinimicrobiota bacterium]MCF7904847.1 DUF5723 family protein [Candidatus Neomarinimicrobiota bacterium]
MRILTKLLLMLSLASFLVAQIDTTATETPVADEMNADPAEEMTQEAIVADTTAADSLLDEELSSTEATSEEVETIMADIIELPTRVIGLVSDGFVTYWSNEGLDALGLEQYLDITRGEPGLVAAQAKDCLDIVCNLLAADSSHADFVFVTPTDSSNVQVYEIATRTTVIEAPADEIALAFANFLGESPAEQAIVEEVVTEQPEAEAEPMVLGPDRSPSSKIRNLQFRNMDALFTNPANLGRDFASKTAWNILPDFRVNIHNSLLTPGWYKEWFTTGEVWDAAMKQEYLSTITDQDLTIRVYPEFQTILGFRIKNFGFNASTISHLKATIPGNLLGLPMRDILFDDPIKNGGIEIEAVPLVVKSTLSYAQPLKTAFGALKVGANLNVYEAAGYLNVVSDELRVTLTEDSVEVHATGEAWVTAGNAESIFENFEGDDIEPSDLLSNISFGVDVGAVLDLYDRLDQEVEVHVLLRNLGAKYKWSNVTHELWSYDLVMPAVIEDGDSIEAYETEETTLIASDEELSVSVPMVFSLGAVYQPFSRLIVGGGIQKAFTDEYQLGYSPDLQISLQGTYYLFPWFDISYSLKPRFGDSAHSFGGGFHFGFLDMGMRVSLINGFNSEAKGLGFGFHSSLHF